MQVKIVRGTIEKHDVDGTYSTPRCNKQYFATDIVRQEIVNKQATLAIHCIAGGCALTRDEAVSFKLSNVNKNQHCLLQAMLTPLRGINLGIMFISYNFKVLDAKKKFSLNQFNYDNIFLERYVLREKENNKITEIFIDSKADLVIALAQYNIRWTCAKKQQEERILIELRTDGKKYN